MIEEFSPPATLGDVRRLEKRLDMLEALILQMQPPPKSVTVSPANHTHDPRDFREPPDPSWLPILHRMVRPDPAYPRPCGGVAHYLTQPPQEHVPASLDLIRICPLGERTWRAPQRGIDEPRCDSCGVLVDPFSNADLDYLTHLRPAGQKPARKSRRGSGEDRAGVSSAPEPRGGVSPGSPRVDSDLLSTLPGHTPTATFDVLQDVAKLQQLADDAGLFDDRRIR